MSFTRRSLGLILSLLLIGVVAHSQTPRSSEDPRNPAPTVTGGTGLFTVYDTQTLRKGEFNIGLFANHFHRDPGDIAWQVYPVNFQVGFNDYLEVFAYFEAQRVVSVGAPALLSGFYLPDVRTPGLPIGRTVIIPGTNTITRTTTDPCGNGGFLGPCAGPNRGPFVARPGGNDTAVYPGLGAPVGGILPAIPFSAQANPSYYPNAPFLARRADNHVGDVWLGGKIRLTGPERAFGIALIPVVKIPTTRELNTGLERGRGTGAFDFGLITAVGGRLSKYINLSANIGFIKKGDPRADDMNLGPLCVGCGVIQGFGSSDRALDLPNELRSGIGIDFPLSQYLQLIAEVNSTVFVGSRTPSLLENDPFNFVAGARIFPARWFAIHAAYQRHLNQSNIDTVHDAHGFIFGLSLGHLNGRKDAVPPPPPNQPPAVALAVGPVTAGSADLLRASTSTVCVGDKVALTATASDPNGDPLLYAWKSSGGQIVGQGANTQFDTAGLEPGDYTVTVEVNDGRGGVASDSKTIRVEACPPLTVCFGPNLDVVAVPSSADAGEKINLSTTGVSGGRNYGAVRYEWSTTAGTISGSGLAVVLDTTGARQGSTIDVTVRAISEAGGCSASGSARVSVKTPPPPPKPPEYSEIGQCMTFKQNNARVDNACKEILQTRVVPALQADPTARLVIDGFRADNERPANLDLQRAKNTRDRLADGASLNVQIDVNRISVRPGGVSMDGSQVKIYFVPSGAAPPPGPAAVDVGPVTPEKKAAPQPSRRRR
jgi:PKD domain/Putative MetA-pathway of phenol degradation